MILAMDPFKFYLQTKFKKTDTSGFDGFFIPHFGGRERRDRFG